MGTDISKYTNNDNVLPTNVNDNPWLYENVLVPILVVGWVILFIYVIIYYYRNWFRR